MINGVKSYLTLISVVAESGLLKQQGYPTAIFGKISVRKTICDLEFSEHLL